MVVHNISNWTEFTGATIGTGDTINITADFTANGSTVVDLKDAIVNGGNYTITFSSRSVGLFKVSGATINNLRVDGDNGTLSSSESLFLAYTNGSQITRDQYATFSECSAMNVTLQNYGGGFISRFATQNSTNTTTFDKCRSTSVTLGSRFCGGFAGDYAKKITITNSYVDLTVGSSTECGGFIGENSLGDISITCSNVRMNQVTGGGVGGLIGQIGAGPLTISECFVIITNGISGTYSGGLIGGMDSSVSNNNTINLSDSYIVADVSSNAGAFVGYHTYGSNNIINVNRCYHIGTISSNGRSVVGWFMSTNGELNVTDCVINSTDYNTYSDNPTLLRVDTSNEGIDQRLPDGTDQGQSSVNGFVNNFNSSIWTAGTDASNNYPTLNCFANASNWNGYTGYNQFPTLTGVGSYGDPHIYTFLGKKRYDYHTCGYSRYLNTIDGSLVINCKIERMGPTINGVVNEPQKNDDTYITKLFIWYKNSYLEITPGLDKKLLTSSVDKSEINDDIKIINLNPNAEKSKIQLLVNMIIKLGSDYVISLGRDSAIFLSAEDQKVSNYQGLAADQKWAEYSLLSDYNNKELLEMKNNVIVYY